MIKSLHLSAIYLVCMASTLFAQVLYADSSLFSNQLFDNQRSVYESKSQVKNFRLALSKFKKVNSRWLSDREELVSGELVRRTIELDRGYLLNDAITELENYFSSKSAQELYSCDGLDCGSSNAWANNYFGVRQLYGLDTSQLYRVWTLRENTQLAFVSAYLVQRGNKRIYLHMDVLVPKQQQASELFIAPSVSSVLNALQNKKYYQVPQLGDAVEFKTRAELVSPIAEALNQNKSLSIAVVGHDYVSSYSEQRESKSLIYAEQVRELLVSSGVSANRIEVKGLGDLAPHILNQGSGVFIVLRSPAP